MISITGIAEYDRLAKDSTEEFESFIKAVKENGWIVKPTSKLPTGTVAEFFPRKRRFYYDPARMTVLDMLHEQKHLQQFKQRGNWKTRDGQVWRDELEAYTYEKELGEREGFSAQYMEFLAQRIEYYRTRLADYENA